MKTKATIITPEELATLKRPLPKSWTSAFGLLKGQGEKLQAEARKLRQEWDHRLKQLERDHL